MEKDTIKNLICVLVFLAFAGLIVLFTLVDINLPFINFSSVKGIISKREELLELESKLETTQTNYQNVQMSLVSSQNSFITAKNKYESISDETINLIKEATTEENYDIEYMWIRLGNYATANNLKIVMIEPGGTSTDVQTNDTTDNKSDNKNSSSTQNSTSTTTKNDSTLFTVTVEGSYLNVADFVFEVENDKELRFKLDNILMTYVQGTTIQTKFDVKHVIMLK